MNFLKSIIAPILNEVFNPDIQEVHLNDTPLKGTQKRTENGLAAMVYNMVESFDPPLGEITMSSGQQGVSNRSGKYTHDYTVTMSDEGYMPGVTLTPPEDSVLEYLVNEPTPTEDPLIWNVRVSVKSPPGEEVTEEPTVGFSAIPVGIPENPNDSNLSIGNIVSSGYGTDINYKLKQPANIQAVVYDMNGRAVEVLSNGKQPSGENKLHWKSYDDASGVYIIKIQVEGQMPQSVKVFKK